MSDTMKLALELGAVDLMSGVLKRAKNNIKGLGQASRQVQKDFAAMEKSMTKGLKGIAIGWFGVKKAIPGIKTASSLQEAMLGVKANLAGSAKDAADLKRQLADVRGTAVTVSADAPFSAEDVVRIENSLLKAGMNLKDVAGKSGAAFAATALASLSKEAPEMVGDSMARIGSMFKLEGGQYSDLADWLVRVDDASTTSLPELIQGLRMAGSTAADLKIPVNDALTTLGALSPLGDRAGSSFNNFLVAITTKGDKLKKLKINLFENGKFIGMERATEMLQKRFGQIQNDEKRMNILMKIFGEEGGRAANILINASKGFSEIEEAAKQSLSMTEKLNIWAEGLGASVNKLGGSWRSTVAGLFEPMLKPLTVAVNLTNRLVSSLGELAGKDNVLGKIISYSTSAGVTALGLGGLAYGGYHLLKGGRSGMRALRGAGGLKGLLGGASSTAVGIATGKAIEAATGVQPVFVTNWPAGGFGSGGGSGGLLDDVVKGGGKGGLMTRLKAYGQKAIGAITAGAAGYGGMLTGSVTAAPVLVTAGSAAAAGYGGYKAGQGLNWIIGKIMEKASGGKYKGEGSLGDWFYDFTHKDENRITAIPQTKNEINLSISVDQTNKLFTISDDNNTTVNVKRGRFGVTH